ncbi:MAG: molybdopterin-guanine dinucleotide biosynthesis protein MobB [Pseudomonadota bacterium]
MKALVRELLAHGLRLSAVKHAHRAIDIHVPGEIGYRHHEAGAHEVTVAFARR